ncbi:hypothetical protein HPB49_021412 [Dermacentor silvarum]|uniref:Uncharacterized protein n=1 Tax=Dermacentor silvarum TaxID=543639 RepID=A0ACB8E3H1_DERSI|nr:hypothetical protein HPB49_021412 [Dermacentor silvarum]
MRAPVGTAALCLVMDPSIPATPCIVFSGEDVEEADLHIKVDSEMFAVKNGEEGLAAVLSAYWLFNIQYDRKLFNTLVMLDRLFLGLTLSTPRVVATKFLSHWQHVAFCFLIIYLSAINGYRHERSGENATRKFDDKAIYYAKFDKRAETQQKPAAETLTGVTQPADNTSANAPALEQCEGLGTNDTTMADASAAAMKRTHAETTEDSHVSESVNVDGPPAKAAPTRRLSFKPKPTVPPDKRIEMTPK